MRKRSWIIPLSYFIGLLMTALLVFPDLFPRVCSLFYTGHNNEGCWWVGLISVAPLYLTASAIFLLAMVFFPRNGRLVVIFACLCSFLFHVLVYIFSGPGFVVLDLSERMEAYSAKIQKVISATPVLEKR